MEKNKSVFLILLVSLLLMNFASAQTPQSQIYNIISQLSAVIFIIIFVLILLVIGGVIKMPKGRGVSLGWLGFIILIILLFILPQFISFPAYLEVPENFKIYSLPSYAASVFEMLGLPSEWMYVPAIIYLFILPFAAIYALSWAFLQSLSIFTNVSPSINRVLAFIIAFLTIPIGWFVKIVWVLFSFMGIWSVVIFAATFIVGIFFRGYGVARKEYATTLQTYESVGKELTDKLIELQKKVDELTSADIEREVNRLAEKYGGLYPRIKDLASQVLSAQTVEAKRSAVKQFKLQ